MPKIVTIALEILVCFAVSAMFWYAALAGAQAAPDDTTGPTRPAQLQEWCTTYCVEQDYRTGQCVRWETICW